MTISAKVETMIEKSSWIRKMFSDGIMLKQKHGAENVFDFSLGNPSTHPPEVFWKVLRETAESSSPADHAYMPNIGRPDVRKAIAEFVGGEQGKTLSEDDIIVTCGAAGALNVILKAIIDPGDEILSPAPYFVEYTFYADNHNGVLKTVPTKPDFNLDLDAIEGALSEKTKALLINSPNNPTGQVYPEKDIAALGKLLEEAGKRFNRTIYLISDEPYRKIVYDGTEVPPLFTNYRNSIVCTSYSKDISIPGERIGFLAVNPDAEYRSQLIDGMSIANRILGFVNAPAFMQRVIGKLQGMCVDMSEYSRKRELLCEGLEKFGYEFAKPGGAFYLFPKAPIPDDVEFVRELQKELILTVPGSGFGGPGHFRIAYCVDDATIKNAMPGFERVMKKFK